MPMKPLISPNGLKHILTLALLIVALIDNVSAQNTVAVPFTNGFVGDNSGNNAATNCVYLNSLGWTNIQFSQNSSSTTFVAQGNDIIGNVIITDASGIEHSIAGFIKWRAPSNPVTTLVFSPSETKVLATSSGSYTISPSKYVGLTFNGKTLTISGGSVSGNAATQGLLDQLNSYLGSLPALSILDYSVVEGSGAFNVEITLSAASANEVRVNYVSAVGTASTSDYQTVSGTLIFSAGQTSKTVSLSTLSDLLNEGTEYFYLYLTDPVNASVIKGTSTITVIDNPPLPIELQSFTGEDYDGTALLKWTTNSEHNSTYFELSRLRGDGGWTIIANIPAAENSCSAINYHYHDESVLYGNKYYRLRIYHTDGSFKDFDLISVNGEFNAENLEVYPNPSRGVFSLHVKPSVNGIHTVQIKNMEGNLLFEKVFENNSLTSNLQLSDSSLSPGVYFITVEQQQRILTTRLIVY